MVTLTAMRVTRSIVYSVIQLVTAAMDLGQQTDIHVLLISTCNLQRTLVQREIVVVQIVTMETL